MSTNTTAPSESSCPRWIAHRGAGRLAPENTLAAFRLGFAHGFRAFECDVKLSADDVPFLLHDDTLERTTTGTGPAGDQTWAWLSRLDAGSWHSPAHAGEHLPSLAAVAAFCLAQDCFLNIELKPSPGAQARTGQRVAAAALQYWQAAAATGKPWPLLSSFSVEALRAARDSAPELPRALLLDSEGRGNWPLASELGCRAVVLEDSLVDEATLQREHRLGRAVLAYTVNDPDRATQLLRWGIDGIITDRVDRLGPHPAASSA